MNLSSIARLAIRKCANLPLDSETKGVSYPQRILIYIHSEDACRLQEVSVQLGVKRAVALRRMLTTYLRINAQAIESLL